MLATHMIMLTLYVGIVAILWHISNTLDKIEEHLRKPKGE